MLSVAGGGSNLAKATKEKTNLEPKLRARAEAKHSQHCGWGQGVAPKGKLVSWGVGEHNVRGEEGRAVTFHFLEAAWAATSKKSPLKKLAQELPFGSLEPPPCLRGPLYASGRSQQGAQQKPSGAAPRSPACSPRPRAAQPQERELEAEPRVASRRREHLRGRTAYRIGSQRSATLTGAAQGEPSSLQDVVQDVSTP